MKKYLLPAWDMEDGISSGTFIDNPQFCNRNYHCGKCAEHYKRMKMVPAGFYTCPYGLSTLVREIEGSKFIFTGFRERNTYRKKGVLSIPVQDTKSIYNPILPAEQINKLVEASIQNESSQTKVTDILSFADDTMHELRALNSAIKSKCDIIWNTCPQNSNSGETDDLLIEILQYVKNIHSSSYMIQSRFMLYDYFRNPSGQSFGDSFIGGIYKKFDKLRMILHGYGGKYLKFQFIGSSKLCYPLHSSFEILVFSILENAIKYSPVSGDIRVRFQEIINAHCNKLTVFIESEGPYCEPEELSKVFSRGIRGKNATKIRVSGTGIGLYLSKTLADLHKISLEATSTKTKEINGVLYGIFCVKMIFDETLLSEPNF